MLRSLITILLVMHYLFVNAQSSLELQAGWTISKIRTAYPPTVNLGATSDDLIYFPVLHSPSVGIEYHYQHNSLILSSGLSFMNLGSSEGLLFKDQPWFNFYWIVPLLVGYQIKPFRNGAIYIRGGADFGFRQGYGTSVGERIYWGNINIVLDAKVQWKQFSFGLRGQLGTTVFYQFGPFAYRHTGLTTYLSYTFWNSKKAKTRRLERQQAKQLTE